ncbi:conserved hypothetical protein [Ricinus communis]|uniref:Uncharacterized protein n=1 Tax=Ricinus communis TaxID=3988 RepID=B9T4N2_RICCO|nr:conserved hypothetical protein [Ricinus communis]
MMNKTKPCMNAVDGSSGNIASRIEAKGMAEPALIYNRSIQPELGKCLARISLIVPPNKEIKATAKCPSILKQKTDEYSLWIYYLHKKGMDYWQRGELKYQPGIPMNDVEVISTEQSLPRMEPRFSVSCSHPNALPQLLSLVESATRD